MYNGSMKRTELETKTSDVVTIPRAEYDAIRAENEHLRNLYDQLLEKFVLAQRNRFGSKAEPASDEVMEQLSFMFDEPEATTWVEQQKENTEEVVVAAHTRKRNSGSVLDVVPEGAEIVTEDHVLAGDDLNCPVCGNQMVEIGVEVRRTLEIIPEKIIVHEDIYHNYACKECEKESDQALIVKTPKEPAVIPGSFASASIIAYIMVMKYVMFAPLYRQEQNWKRRNLELSRQTMSHWLVKSAHTWLKPLFETLHQKLLLYEYLNADETEIQVLHEPGKRAQSKSYMWVYRSSAFDEKAVVIYEYQKTRKKDHPKEFLKDFEGTIVTDGYQSYHGLAKESEGRIKVAGCWVHTLRKYKDAIKSMDKSGLNTAAGTLAAQAIGMIQTMMHKDNQLEGLSPEERYEQRKEKIAPLVDEYFEWVKESRPKVTRQSKTGKAFTYSVEQEQYLREFLTDGNIPMENNAAERAIRPFTIGRKNWVMCDTIHGAEDSAIIYSITETAKANDLKPYEYLKHLLTEIPKHMDDTDMDFLEDLLPWSDKLPAECRKQYTES